jgi:hypothetical protein
MKVKLYDDDGNEQFVTLPSHKEVCTRCNGSGVHDHPAFSNGFTGEEMDELGDDFREEYMAGRYDVRCSECQGDNVVDVPNDQNLTPDQQTNLDRWREHCQGEADYQAEVAAERRMGA